MQYRSSECRHKIGWFFMIFPFSVHLFSPLLKIHKWTELLRTQSSPCWIEAFSRTSPYFDKSGSQQWIPISQYSFVEIRVLFVKTTINIDIHIRLYICIYIKYIAIFSFLLLFHNKALRIVYKCIDWDIFLLFSLFVYFHIYLCGCKRLDSMYQIKKIGSRFLNQNSTIAVSYNKQNINYYINKN